MNDNFLEITDAEREANRVKAPVELVVDFLTLVSANEDEIKIDEALEKARDIQEIEPDNKLISDYIKTLQALRRRKEEQALFGHLESDDDDDTDSEEDDNENDSDEEDDSEEEDDSDDEINNNNNNEETKDYK
eukprot:TRINITY_DN43882_c0_g1_i1.p1 TRINITY_DN43882_c0_g1~~TRINITY_DN43882_c0_g1_i1.p1  ORF type:complete len:155 (+),score=21.91 TRINITY_DN43882_c0_g1_i1:68-466(+)